MPVAINTKGKAQGSDYLHRLEKPQAQKLLSQFDSAFQLHRIVYDRVYQAHAIDLGERERERVRIRPRREFNRTLNFGELLLESNVFTSFWNLNRSFFSFLKLVMASNT